MEAVAERPVDTTLGLELVTGDEISLNASRALFLAADLLDPNRRREIGLVDGGEELPNRCLRRTSGLLPRCSITPLEFWGDPLPLELFPDGVRPYKLKGEPSPEVTFNPNGPFNPRLRDKPLFFMPLFPGELIRDALEGGRGIVEIQVLKTVDYGSEYTELQDFFFPVDYVKPIALRLIREHIEQRASSVADPDIRAVADDMLLSCEQSHEYMSELVSVANTQLAERVSFRHTHRLTPKIRHFMAQLELAPTTDKIVAVQDKVAEAVSQSGISGDQLEQILNRVLGEVSKQAEKQPGAAQPAE